MQAVERLAVGRAGRAPFERAAALEEVAAILREAPEPLEKFAPAIPEAYARLVRRAIASKQADRFSFVDELLADLKSMRLALMLENNGHGDVLR